MDALKKKEQMIDQAQTKKPPLTALEEAVFGPTLLLESSFIIAYLNQDDPNHKSVKSLLGFVQPHNCKFHIPLLVSVEVISKLIHKNHTVANAIKKYNQFVNTLPGGLFLGTSPNLEDILDRYKKYTRNKLKDLQGNDFIIVTEGIVAGSIILTCDYEMYQKAKKYHEDIYFVATDSNKYSNDVTDFVNKFLVLIGATKKNGT